MKKNIKEYLKTEEEIRAIIKSKGLKNFSDSFSHDGYKYEFKGGTFAWHVYKGKEFIVDIPATIKNHDEYVAVKIVRANLMKKVSDWERKLEIEQLHKIKQEIEERLKLIE
ncbi:hypothetical protein [Vibrio cholerae]|uniref:hypothetical protein n=1 Tax=Vibrio cholerae TaxID=666 RepID=UPI0011D61EF0|nr:hypothetical protein [Vibrio cholerae]TXX49220.1 hypothetical protein FXF14_08375 [Vibrio cholerae]